MNDFRNLQVWQRACELCVETHQLADLFPSKVRFGLGEQLRRASLSVCTNIAEGWGRGRDRELAQFLRIARGSANETHCCLEIAMRLRFISAEAKEHLEGLALEVKKMLTSFLRRLGRLDDA